MTTASALEFHICSPREPTARILTRLSLRAADRIGTRQRAYATCHLTGSSTLVPRGD